MTPAAHARLAPSSASRWVPCPASPRLEAQYPEDEESEAAREGTAAHYVLEELLAGRNPPLGSLAPNGHPVSREMVEGAQMLVDDAFGTLRAATPGLVLRVEERVDAAAIVHPDNWGTPDVVLVDQARRTIHIWDYKFGHRYVDVYRNWQLVDYAACLVESYSLMDTDDYWLADSPVCDWAFTFTIVQPRCYAPEGPVREWITTGAELVPLWQELRDAARAASEPEAICQTGGHCRDCRAAWDCRANQLAVGNAVDLAYEARPAGMSRDALGLETRILTEAAARLKQRLAAVEAESLGRIRRGETVPGVSIGWTQPRERWIEGAEDTVASLGDMFGVEMRASGTILTMTPKQAVKAGIDRSVISEYAETPPGSAKLVLDDQYAAARVFGQR